MMKKKLGVVFLLLVFALNLSAQRRVSGVEFMADKAKTMEMLEKKFGTPYLLGGGKATYKNVVFDGETYNEAECFFNEEGKLNQLRLKTNCGNRKNAIARMNKLAKKYEQSYNTTYSENSDDGKFVVGYDTKGGTTIMISTFKNSCQLSFGLF